LISVCRSDLHMTENICLIIANIFAPKNISLYQYNLPHFPPPNPVSSRKALHPTSSTFHTSGHVIKYYPQGRASGRRGRSDPKPKPAECPLRASSSSGVHSNYLPSVLQGGLVRIANIGGGPVKLPPSQLQDVPRQVDGEGGSIRANFPAGVSLLPHDHRRRRCSEDIGSALPAEGGRGPRSAYRRQGGRTHPQLD
jgi:hypothetical protein